MRATVYVAGLTLCVMTQACAGSLEQAQYAGVQQRKIGITRPVGQERCDELDDRRMLWGGVAKGAALVAGASGISTLPVPADNEAAQIGLGAGALTAAAVAAVAIAIAEGAATSWVRDCSKD